MISQILTAMRDVDGVHGSFVVTKTGALVGKDLPAMFDDDVLTAMHANPGERHIARFPKCLKQDGVGLFSAPVRHQVIRRLEEYGIDLR